MNTQNIFLYFFSTLAQCAAAFAALAAVFGVFRLQSSSLAVEDAYRDSWYWIRQRCGVMSPLDVNFSKKHIKDQLIAIKDGEIKYEAEQWVRRINQLERFPQAVAYNVSVPLKLWAIVFFTSLTSLLFSRWSECWFCVAVVVIELFLTLAALSRTRTFIQDCLKIEGSQWREEAP